MTVKKLANKTAKKFPLPRSLKQLYPNVEHAVDASKPIEIVVDAKDCKEAERLNPTECALARAAKRELKADGVIIGMQSSYIIKGNVAVRFATPESVRREIVSFDRHQDFAPGEYYLTPKSPSMKLGKNYHPDRYRGEGGKIKSARRKHHMSARVRILPSGSE